MKTRSQASVSKLVVRASGAALVLAALAASSPAAATPGMILDSNHLPAQAATDLRLQIDKQRALDPASFRSVHDLAARAPALDARARNHRAPIALYLQSIGPSAVLPIVDMLAFSRPSDVPLGVRRDMVEALGFLRDARAMPVLGAILERETDPHLVRTTAAAVGRMESDEAVQRLLSALASSQGDRATAILAGMGTCHREAIARALASRLASRPDAATARATIVSLGRTGNAWAWQTLAQRGEEAATRAAAAKALVAAFVAYDGDTRQEASDALMVVDDPSTPSLIADAQRSAAPALAKDLDALAQRFARNPARTK